MFFDKLVLWLDNVAMDNTQKMADFLGQYTGKNNFWYAKWLNYFCGVAFSVTIILVVFFEELPQWFGVGLIFFGIFIWDRHRSIKKIKEQYYTQNPGLMNQARVDPGRVRDRNTYVVMLIFFMPVVFLLLLTMMVTIHAAVVGTISFYEGVGLIALFLLIMKMLLSVFMPPLLMACTPYDSGMSLLQRIREKMGQQKLQLQPIKIK